MARITCNWCRYLTSYPSTPVAVTLSLKCVIIIVLLLVIYTAALIMFLELRHSASYIGQKLVKQRPLGGFSYDSSSLSLSPSYDGDRSNTGGAGGSGGGVGTPTTHYGVVVDCGSSGSRVYVYRWPTHSGDPNELLRIGQLTGATGQPVVKKIIPGLSTFANDPSAASAYLKPLLSYAAMHIPQEKHTETVLYILATAGMRVLSETVQKRILDELQTSIPRKFRFVVAENHFEVITGKQEGVYGWIAVNYILDKFAHGIEDHPLVVVDVAGQTGDRTPHIRRRTVGVIDMGGGSMQIAFEVTKNVKFDYAKEGLAKDLMAEFNLGCKNSVLDHNYQLYVSTFLGYGANSARRRYEAMLLKMAANSSQGYDKLSPIPDPCLPLGLDYTSTHNSWDMYFVGLGDYIACRRSIRPLLNLTVPCQKSPCSINGIYQPEINFHNSEFYGFSEFWYSMEDVYRIGGHYDADKFDKVSIDHCATRWAKVEEWFHKKFYPKSDIRRLRLQCFKAAWMSVVLHDGFKFPRDYLHFYSTQKIDGKDVQWTLGALIHRTRYLPLREIEQSATSHGFHPDNWGSKRSPHFYYEYLILVCFLVVVTAIVLYVRRLRRLRSLSSSALPSSPSSAMLLSTSSSALLDSSSKSPIALSTGVGGSTALNRVPSSSYFMMEDSGGGGSSSKMMDSVGGLYFKNSSYS